MQDKMDKYIKEFIMLNMENKKVLSNAHEKFNQDYEFKL
jgi:hypothetical protein